MLETLRIEGIDEPYLLDKYSVHIYGQKLVYIRDKESGEYTLDLQQSGNVSLKNLVRVYEEMYIELGELV